MIGINVTNYDNNGNTEAYETRDDCIKSIEIAYDGGRVSLFINGVPVDVSLLGSRDFYITIEDK